MMEGVLAHGRGWTGMGFKVPSEPNPSETPCLCGSCCSLSFLSRASTGLPFQQKGAAQLPLTSRAGCPVKRFFPMGCSKDGVALGFIPSGPKCRAWVSYLAPRGAEVRLEALPSKGVWPEEHWREEDQGGQSRCGEETRRHNSLITFI